MILLSSGMQAPTAEVDVVLEAPSEVKEGMCTHFHPTIRQLLLIWQ